MFSFAREVLSAFFPLKYRTMLNTNPFQLLFPPTLSMETETFLFIYWSGVTSSSDPSLALSRFKVKNVSVK